MRFTRTSKALGMVAIAALALTGCGAGGGSNEGASDAAGDPAKIITAYSNEPQNPLLPANTNEVYGGRVVELLFEGLTSYSPSGESVNALAESIESPDGQNYTIKVKSGTKFTNGEEVTAKSFVDAWNFAALSTNAQANSSFFESIEGYDAVSATKKEGETEVPAPTAETLSGLVLKDDSTIEVKLTQPEADWPLRLGYTAFMPLPSEAIADPKAFGENPVGNGPYKMAKEGAWQHDSQIELVKNEDYTGTREAKNGGVTFKFYTDPAPAYTDIQANNLKNNLGIQVEGQPFAKFAELLDLRKSQTLPGFARAGWQADYPSLYNFLGPLLRTGSSANYEGYSNPEFDKLLDEGLGSKSTDDANAKFTEAQEILFQDLPNLPLWYSARQVVWSQNVTNVDSGWNGVIQYYNITAK